MRLATIVAVARARAASLDYDATYWHRLACLARERIRQERAERRKAERKNRVIVPEEIAPFGTMLDPLDEDEN